MGTTEKFSYMVLVLVVTYALKYAFKLVHMICYHLFEAKIQHKQEIKQNSHKCAVSANQSLLNAFAILRKIVFPSVFLIDIQGDNYFRQSNYSYSAEELEILLNFVPPKFSKELDEHYEKALLGDMFITKQAFTYYTSYYEIANYIHVLFENVIKNGKNMGILRQIPSPLDRIHKLFPSIKRSNEISLTEMCNMLEDGLKSEMKKILA